MNTFKKISFALLLAGAVAGANAQNATTQQNQKQPAKGQAAHSDAAGLTVDKKDEQKSKSHKENKQVPLKETENTKKEQPKQ